MKVLQVSLTCTYLPTPCWQHLVLEPDPLIIEKEGLVNWLGWKCTLRLVCRRTSDWLLSDVHLLEMLAAREPSCVLLRFRSCKHQAGKIERLYVCLVQQCVRFVRRESSSK